MAWQTFCHPQSDGNDEQKYILYGLILNIRQWLAKLHKYEM